MCTLEKLPYVDYTSSEDEDAEEEEDDKPKAIKVGKKAKNESDSGSDVSDTSFYFTVPIFNCSTLF